MGQDRAEALDDDKLGTEVPPESPLGVEDYGTTAAEERYDEPLEERLRREEPDDPPVDDAPIQLVDDGDDDLVTAAAADAATADETLGDVATELEAPPPAEEAAVHETTEP
jgi:hypothetical protein